MRLQVRLKFSVIPNECVVIYAAGIATQLFPNFPVTVKKLAELGRIAVGISIGIAIVSELTALRIVNALFLVHEVIGILPEFILNALMALQVSSKFRVVIYEIPFLHERWILPYLLGDFAVTIHKSVEILRISTSAVSIPKVFAGIETIFLMHKLVRVLSYVISNSRMVLQKCLQGRVSVHEIPVVK
jgi:hypothetical protein